MFIILKLSCLLLIFLLLTLLGLCSFAILIILCRGIKRGRRLETMKKTKRITKTAIPANCIYLGLDMARKSKKKYPTVDEVEKKVKTKK